MESIEGPKEQARVGETKLALRTRVIICGEIGGGGDDVRVGWKWTSGGAAVRGWGQRWVGWGWEEEEKKEE